MLVKMWLKRMSAVVRGYFTCVFVTWCVMQIRIVEEEQKKNHEKARKVNMLVT